MMDMVITLLAVGLAAVAVTLAVARIRAQRRTEGTARELMETHREFGKSIDRLFEAVAAPNPAGVSRRNSPNETSSFYGVRRARAVSQSGRAAFCGDSRRYGSMQPAYWARHSRIRFSENYRWEDEWTSHEDDAYERASRLA